MVLTKYLRRHFIERAISSFSAKGRVLEIGSGQDWRYCPTSITVNRDESARPDLICDAEHLTLEDESFDTALCIEVIEHTTSPHAIVSEIHRVLRPGGRLLLTVPFVFEIHDTRDYYRFTRMGLEHLLRDFSEVNIRNDGGVFCVMFHFIRLSPIGKLLFPLLNNLGFYLDWIFRQKDPRITLGYTVTAIK